MTFPIAYHPATQNAGRCQPGAQALMNWCLTNTTATNLGCYANRRIRGGTRLSVHAAGRALDLGFPYTRGGTPEGWELANLLREHHADLGVQYLIYARRQWTATRNRDGWRRYNGLSAHYEHIHAELNRYAAPALTREMINNTLGDTMKPYQIEAVTAIQQALAAADYDLGPTGVDGDPGPATATAVTQALADLAAHRDTNKTLRAQLADVTKDTAAGKAFIAALTTAGIEL